MRSLVISLLLLPIVAIAYPREVEFGWSQSECRPGDVIELRASGVFDELTSYELRLPQHKNLHLVAHQRHPVHYEDGVYSQRDVWLLQPKAAGTIQLETVRVILRTGGAVTEEERAVPALLVEAYSDPADSNAPQLLGDDEATTEETAPIWWVILLLAVAPVVLLFRYLRKQELADAPEQVSVVSLATVRSSLAEGTVPVEQIERLLADGSQQLSASQRVALESAIYGQSADVAALLAQLAKEDAV